ncbi:S1 RNA-binding domain-containing protein [Desulfolucanica intricata]|uniref:S1 RNA-binding domain-containing protein n=1 Tax=Desulfolucanica intricata TaxID=1285191 RepID=UPI0008369FB1|nr:S1 RNA-binding domain-containing protein [Desulfolucanica intricata]
MPIEVGSIVEGIVTGITNFGAFVELEGGQTGLVHISEVSDVYVKDINDFLKIGDKVKVKVVTVDPKGKIGLSIKRTIKRVKEPPYSDRRKKSKISFEDKLSKFLRESEEKQQSLKRSTDAKRGGRGASRRTV